jgi:hypothetical protein
MDIIRPRGVQFANLTRSGASGASGSAGRASGSGPSARAGTVAESFTESMFWSLRGAKIERPLRRRSTLAVLSK